MTSSGRLPPVSLLKVIRIPDCDGENTSGLVSVLVLGFIQDIVFADTEAVAGKLRGHDVLDLDVVGKNGFFPIDLKPFCYEKLSGVNPTKLLSS